MGYDILPHTADVGIAAWAPTLSELFAEAARATAHVVLDREPPPPAGAVPVVVEEDDLGAALVSFLGECLYVFESTGALVVGARVEVDGEGVRGDLLTAEATDRDGPAIKAVTFHGLLVEQRDGGWRAEAYFDV